MSEDLAWRSLDHVQLHLRRKAASIQNGETRWDPTVGRFTRAPRPGRATFHASMNRVAATIRQVNR
jgi:hypothetical protein